ncbi:MAG: exodeoxyribonuclease VII small subunit [Eggerthellaceae bacterium]|nr:exodeoxyribonuclease VII small subunit [Eggerthellaceae bacterium]
MSHDDARSFEDIKTRLDEIVSLVSDDSLPLDEALDLYEEAVGIGLQASRIMEEGIAEKEAEQAARALLDAIPSETKADL